MADVNRDPRGVRARIVGGGGLSDAQEEIRVGPSPARLLEPDAEDGVLAQRHLLVDGVATPVELDAQAVGRAVLREGAGVDASATRVVLEQPLPMQGRAIRREVLVDGFRFMIDVEEERVAALRERASRGRAASAHGGPLRIDAIIPGKVVAVSVAVGDPVTAGQQILVVEAMKMQNELRSPRDGTIEQVGVDVGDRIEVGDLLVVVS